MVINFYHMKNVILTFAFTLVAVTIFSQPPVLKYKVGVNGTVESRELLLFNGIPSNIPQTLGMTLYDTLYIDGVYNVSPIESTSISKTIDADPGGNTSAQNPLYFIPYSPDLGVGDYFFKVSNQENSYWVGIKVADVLD